MRDLLETRIVAASAAAVGHVVDCLKKGWKDEYLDPTTRPYPAVQEVVETVLQFEIACRLRNLVGARFDVSWEHAYAPDYPAHVDLVVVGPGQRRNGPRRTAIELKWMSAAKGGLDGLASDALKLAWCAATRRYVLGIGRREPASIEDDLRHAILKRVRWQDEERDLRKARSNLMDCRLIPIRRIGKVTVALFRVDHKRTL